jgi:hypothetical protein
MELRVHKLSSSIFSAAAHDGTDLLVLVTRNGHGSGSRRTVQMFRGVSADTFQKLLAYRSTTEFFQQAIWDRFPSEPASLEVEDAIESFFQMQPEGAIRLAPAPDEHPRHSPRRKPHTAAR